MTDASRVVAIGGGHGLACTLRALRQTGADITAVVSVADDGGSSGRLRRDHNIVAPGDVRRCLEALAPPSLFAETIGHRFESGELSGHPVGNVLLAGLLERCSDPVQAIDTLAELMGIEGRVLPATAAGVELIAETNDGDVRGQVAIGETSGIVGLRWSPALPVVPPQVLNAIADAELIVLGPGSLYTSVLAAVVPDVRAALELSAGRLVYVANLEPQQGETSGYSLADHVAAVEGHGVSPAVVVADCDNDPAGVDVELVSGPLAAPAGGAHDPTALADLLGNLLPAVRR